MIGDLAFIGFGEAGEAFAAGIARDALRAVAGFDIAPARGAAMRALGVAASDRAGALAGAGAVWCLVTADRAAEVAAEAAPFLSPGTLWFDGNSCSPGTKARAAAIIEGAGGRYVDVAIMAPVHPGGAAVPLLIAGPHAAEAAGVLTALGMRPRIAGDTVGQASTIKMMRSVMIKGIEALTAECVLGARRAGVEDAVLASLQASDPGFDWSARSSYCLERMARHGRRRAAEMREVVRTLRELGLPDRMAGACADWQDEIGALNAALSAEAPVAEAADTLLAALSPTRP
ncbi:MAG: NAD(P)-dependent oxidoreductase [Pararhodobacter sp.]